MTDATIAVRESAERAGIAVPEMTRSRALS